MQVARWLALSCAIGVLACAPAASQDDGDEWIRSDWSPHVQDVRDRGRGVVFTETAPDRPAPPRTDTLAFRLAPDATASLTAMLLTEYDGAGGWRYVLMTREAVEPNLLEYGYEEAGVPADSVLGDEWARALLGVRPDGSPLLGWARLEPGTAGHLSWEQHLPNQMIHLPAGWDGAFHDAPAGAIADPPPDLHDVSLYVLQARPPWMLVRFVSPADACAAEDGRARTQTTRWVRYIDERGRPLVWYYTRGC